MKKLSINTFGGRKDILYNKLYNTKFFLPIQALKRSYQRTITGALTGFLWPSSVKDYITFLNRGHSVGFLPAFLFV